MRHHGVLRGQGGTDIVRHIQSECQEVRETDKANSERNILTHLGSQLRRLAASDEIIASRDVPEYIQAVLIPELAILLVKEDMQVDDEGARAIIKESVNLGELLHDEEEDLR